MVRLRFEVEGVMSDPTPPFQLINEDDPAAPPKCSYIHMDESLTALGTKGVGTEGRFVGTVYDSRGRPLKDQSTFLALVDTIGAQAIQGLGSGPGEVMTDLVTAFKQGMVNIYGESSAGGPAVEDDEISARFSLGLFSKIDYYPKPDTWTQQYAGKDCSLYPQWSTHDSAPIPVDCQVSGADGKVYHKDPYLEASWRTYGRFAMFHVTTASGPAPANPSVTINFVDSLCASEFSPYIPVVRTRFPPHYSSMPCVFTLLVPVLRGAAKPNSNRGNHTATGRVHSG